MEPVRHAAGGAGSGNAQDDRGRRARSGTRRSACSQRCRDAGRVREGQDRERPQRAGRRGVRGDGRSVRCARPAGDVGDRRAVPRTRLPLPTGSAERRRGGTAADPRVPQAGRPARVGSVRGKLGIPWRARRIAARRTPRTLRPRRRLDRPEDRRPVSPQRPALGARLLGHVVPGTQRVPGGRQHQLPHAHRSVPVRRPGRRAVYGRRLGRDHQTVATTSPSPRCCGAAD